MRCLLALAAVLLLASCQALWDLPGQMREPYGGTGAPPPPPTHQDAEEHLP